MTLDHLRIPTLGLGGKTAAMLEAGMSASDVAQTLSLEEAETLKAHKVARITKRDVEKFQEYLANVETTAMQTALTKQLQDAGVADRLKKRIDRTLDIMEGLDTVLVDVQADFSRAREQWLKDLGKTSTDNNGKVTDLSSPYPVAHLKALLAASAENREIIKHFQQDRGIQSFIKSTTVNVSSGMPHRDVVWVMRHIAGTLGIDMDRMTTAYGDALDDLARRPTIIEAKVNHPD